MSTDAAIERFLASAALSDATRRAYGSDLRAFGGWLEEQRLGLEDVDARVLDRVRGAARTRPAAAARPGLDRPEARRRSRAASPCSRRRAACRTSRSRRAGRSAFRTSTRPTTSTASCESLEGDGPIPLRNRALGELVYSAGLRSKEAVELDLEDVDFEQEAVRVLGKGGKERVVPLGEEAAHWLARYLRDGRPQLVRGRRERVLRLGPGPPARHEHAPPRHPAPASPAPRVRDAPPGGRRRPPGDPGAARAQLAVDDAGVQPRGRTPPAPRVRSLAPSVVIGPGRHHRVERRRDARRPGHPRRQRHPARHERAVRARRSTSTAGCPDDRYGLASAERGSGWRCVGLRVDPAVVGGHLAAARGAAPERRARRSTRASCRTWRTSARPSRARIASSSSRWSRSASSPSSSACSAPTACARARRARERRGAHGRRRCRRRRRRRRELQLVRDAVPLALLRGRDVALRGDGHAPPAVPRPLLARHGRRHRRAVPCSRRSSCSSPRASGPAVPGARRPLRMQARTEGT